MNIKDKIILGLWFSSLCRMNMWQRVEMRIGFIILYAMQVVGHQEQFMKIQTIMESGIYLAMRH